MAALPLSKVKSSRNSAKRVKKTSGESGQILQHLEENELKSQNGGKGIILAIDPGKRRIGLALSDESQKIAFPYDVLPASTIFYKISEIITEKKVTKIIVGMPYTLRGEVGQQAKRVKKFVDRLKKLFSEIEIELVDERLSSTEAKLYLSSAKNKDKLDSIAASLILERYLRRMT